ncbi:MAG: DUF424 family protein [Methanomassiliicoccales archaeon]|nr:MAG: DUF424 family protein [Methanomassiliicoccales archaeon]
MIWMKVYPTQGEILLAACDEETLGKSFYEGELQLIVSKSFYGGEKVSQELFREQLKEATIVNLVGKEVVGIAQELGLLNTGGIIEIDGVPHAQIAKLI